MKRQLTNERMDARIGMNVTIAIKTDRATLKTKPVSTSAEENIVIGYLRDFPNRCDLGFSKPSNLISVKVFPSIELDEPYALKHLKGGMIF
jgi:hypothetical protein